MFGNSVCVADVCELAHFSAKFQMKNFKNQTITKLICLVKSQILNMFYVN